MSTLITLPDPSETVAEVSDLFTPREVSQLRFHAGRELDAARGSERRTVDFYQARVTALWTALFRADLLLTGSGQLAEARALIADALAADEASLSRGPGR